MFEITRSLCVLPLLVVLSCQPVCSSWVDATRVFLEPVMFKKSCRNGMVANQDYFVVKGLVNISNIDQGNTANILLFYWDYWGQANEVIEASFLKLKGTTCKDTNTVKIDSCTCTSMDAKYVRVLCNLTAKTDYSESYIFMYFACCKVRRYSLNFQMPRIYATPVCIGPSVNRAAKSHPGSFSAVLGTTLLGMAVVCLVSSIFSQV
ncbi:unnamed protein product [Lymnaea stagnalis]|uniref:Uncharacterized protein n=1 Tax=Lymnaea stagnalis TaxID=6523 RepID=A0AAV2HHI9_LYMST